MFKPSQKLLMLLLASIASAAGIWSCCDWLFPPSADDTRCEVKVSDNAARESKSESDWKLPVDFVDHVATQGNVTSLNPLFMTHDYK